VDINLWRLNLFEIVKNSAHTAQETHNFSAPEPNRLMLCGKTVAVCCENRTEHRYRPYLTGDTSRLRYRAQPVNAVWGNSRCLLPEPYKNQLLLIPLCCFPRGTLRGVSECGTAVPPMDTVTCCGLEARGTGVRFRAAPRHLLLHSTQPPV
jgi:hypothetical protein